jgi:hypothetical protein
MSDEYEPHFERLGTIRRVLGFISDEDHLGRPRNTVDVLQEDLVDDPNTAFTDDDDVREHLDELQAHGFVELRDDGTYAITPAGLMELTDGRFGQEGS